MENKYYSKFKPHPWHGIDPIIKKPDVVHAFIEITQYDRIKFEVDPITGYLYVDRPQRNSSLPPNPYGFVPRTLCGSRTGEKMKSGIKGDGDALDICVLSEHDITRSEVVLPAKIIGCLRTTDSGKADPKLIAVLKGDLLWGDIDEISDIPSRQLDRLEHYFRQYKVEKDKHNPVELLDRCGKREALELLESALKDYNEEYSQSED